MTNTRKSVPSAMFRQPAVHEKLARSYTLYAAPEGAPTYRPGCVAGSVAIDLGTLTLEGGRLWLGGHRIHEPRFSRNTVAWSQLSDGIRSIGNLVFSPDGTVVAGQVHVAPGPGPLESYLLFGTAALTTFTTRYSTDGTAWTAGPDLEIGVIFDPDARVGDIVQDLTAVTQVVNVYGCEADGNLGPVNYVEQGLASFALYRQTGTLQVNFVGSVTMTPPACDQGAFAFPLPSGQLGSSSSVIYSEDGTSFSGTVYDFTGQTAYQFEGTATSPARADSGDTAPAPSDYRNFKAGTLTGSNLTVQELAGLQLPEVNKLQNELIYDCLLYVMDPTLRNDLTGDVQPSNLNPAVVSAITQPAQTDFLNGFYAPTYFGYGFSQLTALAANFDPDEVTQLRYTASSVLAQQASFSVINNVVFSQAAVSSSATLQSYVDDTTSGWGNTLYGYITQQPQIVQVQTEVFGANNSDTLNRYVSLLAVFDPTGALSTKYYSAVMGSALFSQCALYMDPGTQANAENLSDILPPLLEQVISEWLTLPPNPTAADLQKQQLAQALQAAGDVVGSLDTLAEELLAAFQHNGDQLSLTARLTQVYQYFSDGDLPAGVKKLAGFVGGIGLVLGITLTIQGLANWNELSASQKVSLVAEGVQTTSTIIEILPDIVTAFANGVQTGVGVIATLYDQWRGNATAFEDLDFDLSDIEHEDDLVFNRDVSTNLGEVASNDFAEQGGKLLFSWGTTFTSILKGVCVLGQVVAAGIAVYDVVEDIINGAPITNDIMNGLEAISLGVVAVCDGVSLFIESAVVATLGVVFAVVGVIVAIIALFVDKPDPSPTPTQQYISGTVLPFINQMTSQYPVPANWSLPTVDSNTVQALRTRQRAAFGMG